ncbi:hypothetical protein [Streptomyces sp. NPDC057729]|uniref:hypothetical protein n=1 Tax=Streptomyces sp. NPDC057729 TaxID=3346230 RepID=UPI003673CC4B
MAWLAGMRITATRLRDNAPFLVNYTSITSSTPTTTSTAPSAAITTPPITFRAGRAYRVAYRGGMSSSTVGQQGTMTITKGTAAGAAVMNSQRVPGPAGQAGTVGFYFENIVANNGADTTTALVGTYAMTYQSGTGTIAVFGSAVTPAYLEVVDIGVATDYPSATSL